MITGLNNVGPSLPVISDSPKKGEKGKAVDLLSTAKPSKAKSGADSFQNVLSAKANSADKKEVTAKTVGRENPKKDTLFAPNDDVAVTAEPRMAPEDKFSRDETTPVREKKRIDGKETEDNSNDREEVMLKFMDSMESEFGIPPQRIAEAMTKLSDNELEGSPEDSAPQVISQLNLQPEDQQKALQMYTSFLQKLHSTDASKEATAASSSAKNPAIAGGAALAMPQVASSSVSQQQRRVQLNSTLDQLNNRFFMKADQQAAFQKDGEPLMTSQSSLEAAGTLEDAKPLDQQIDPKNLQAGFDPQKLGMKPVQPGETFNPRELQKAQAMREQNLQAQDQEGDMRATLAAKLAALGAAAGALDKGMQNDPQNLQALNAEQALQQMQNQQQNPGQNLMGAAAVTGAGKAAWGKGDENLDDDSSSQGGKDPFSTNALSAAGSSHTNNAKDASAPTFVGAMSAAQGQPAENNPNIRQIMNQAQYMIKKGGGESKIQLNPEGLGEIHMKVSVKDGKVDLQIATQTHEAKKLVESSMHELRDSLSQKNLGMDAVKVDVGNHLAGDKHHSDQQTQDQSQQRQLDLKQDLSRDQSKSQAREFWSQFNDDSGFNRRGAILDSPGIRAYGGARKADPIQAADTSRASTEARRNVQSGKGRGLDLVA